jgi:hypothetical protein
MESASWFVIILYYWIYYLVNIGTKITAYTFQNFTTYIYITWLLVPLQHSQILWLFTWKASSDFRIVLCCWLFNRLVLMFGNTWLSCKTYDTIWEKFKDKFQSIGTVASLNRNTGRKVCFRANISTKNPRCSLGMDLGPIRSWDKS